MPRPITLTTAPRTRTTVYTPSDGARNSLVPNNSVSGHCATHSMLSITSEAHRIRAGSVALSNAPLNPRVETHNRPIIKQSIDRRENNQNPYIQYLHGRTQLFNFANMPEEISDDGVYRTLYHSNQDTFIKRTQEVVKTTAEIINTNAMRFSDLIMHLGSVRQSIAPDEDPNKGKFGSMRKTTLRTGLIDERYYDLGRKMIGNMLSQSQNADGNIIRENRGPNPSNAFPGCESYTYELFTNIYRNNNNVSIPTTKLAVASSNEFIPHQNGLPLLDCELIDVHNIGKMLALYQALIQRDGLSDANTSYHEVIHEAIGRQNYLQVIKNEFSNARYERWEVIHTAPKYITYLMDRAQEAYNNFLQLKERDQDLAFKVAARCLWFVANACPFERGSSWVTEVLGSAMLSCLPLYSTIGSDLTRSHIDFLAFGLPLDTFCSQFERYCEQHASAIAGL